MIETEISITVNRKSDITLLEQTIVQNKFQFPVYIREYEFSYHISFTSDYEEWELDDLILNTFPEYEFTTDLEKGRKEIRLQISRYQSELSTDGWGRRIENPLDETKYLIKESTHRTPKFNPEVKILFEDKEQFYRVNVIGGFNEATNEKGFLLLKDFKNKNVKDDAEFFSDRLYKSPLEAFHSAHYKLSEVVGKDFSTYLEDKKKEIREIQKHPRKIIRDFIKACNISDKNNSIKNLDENVVFEIRKNWKTIFEIEGLSKFKEYLNSYEQRLLGRDFKIRSSWDFNLPNITIGVKYFPKSSDSEERTFQKYGQIQFVLEKDKIIRVSYAI